VFPKKLFSYVLISLSLIICSCKNNENSKTSGKIYISDAERKALISEARVFKGFDGDSPAKLSEQEIKEGPKPKKDSVEGEDYFKWNSTVTCVFSQENFDAPPSGMSPKFLCDILDTDGDIVKKGVKIKFGDLNGEVYNEAAASRLLWLLGFRHDYYFPVKVLCKDCPEEDPWDFIKRYKNISAPLAKQKMRDKYKATKMDQFFLTALIEKKFGDKIVGTESNQSGWSFFEDLVATNDHGLKIEREALGIFAAMISHVDNQQDNQKLACTKPKDNKCPQKNTWMIIHDLGAAMGGFRISWDWERGGPIEQAQVKTAMDIWESNQTTGVFTGPRSCRIGVFSFQETGTMTTSKHVPVSEQGRQFILQQFARIGGGEIADDLKKPEVISLLRKQLASIFLAGRNANLYRNNDWWVDTMMNKIRLVDQHQGCLQ